MTETVQWEPHIRVVVVSGDDSIGREKARERIVQSIMDTHPDCQEEHFDATRESFQQFGERILTPSLFFPMRIFHIRHVNELESEGVTFLGDILKAPPPDAVIFIEIDPVARPGARYTALVELVSGPKKGTKKAADRLVLKLLKPAEYKLAAWLTEQVPALLGRRISKGDAEYLKELVGAELDKIYSELLKIDILLPAGAPIDRTAIEHTSGATRVMNAFELARAVSAKDFGRCLEIIESMFSTTVFMPSVVGTLFRHFWAMFRIRVFAEANRELMRTFFDRATAYQKKNEIAHQIGIVSGLLGSDDAPAKAYPVVILSNIVDHARGFSRSQMRSIIGMLAAFDADIKSGRQEASASALQLMCYRIVRVEIAAAEGAV